MNKYFPIVLFILVFTGFLSSQIVLDQFKLSAGPTNKEKALKAHYQNVYEKLKVQTIAGEKLNLAQVQAPIVILNFWASWCVPCLEEFPSIVALKKKFPSDDEILIIGVNADENNQEKNIAKKVKEFKLNFKIVADKESFILKQFHISSLPVSLIFHKGKLIQITKGSMDFNSGELTSSFVKILKKEKAEKRKGKKRIL